MPSDSDESSWSGNITSGGLPADGGGVCFNGHGPNSTIPRTFISTSIVGGWASNSHSARSHDSCSYGMPVTTDGANSTNSTNSTIACVATVLATAKQCTERNVWLPDFQNGRDRNPIGPEACRALVAGNPNCSQAYFNYASDRSCGCLAPNATCAQSARIDAASAPRVHIFAYDGACDSDWAINKQDSIWLVAVWCCAPVLVLCATLASVRKFSWLQSPSPVVGVTEKGLKGKFLALEGVRWLAALHIYMFHLNQTMVVGCPNCVYECNIAKFGKYAVGLFFIVSGFISSLVSYVRASAKAGGAVPSVADAPTNHSIWVFWLKRICPLVPLYLVSIVIALFGAYYDRPDGVPLEPDYSDGEVIARTLTFTTTLWQPFHFNINGPAWFVDNLVVFWVFMPHWMHAISLLNAVGRWAVLVLCWAAMWGSHIAMYGNHVLPPKAFANCKNDPLAAPVTIPR